MKQKKAVEQVSNNNKEIIYSYIPDYSISKKLDVITLSIRNDMYEEQIYNFLEANRFKAKFDLKLKEGNYDMKRTYKSDDDIVSIEIMHGVKSTYCPSLIIKIHDANKEFLTLLHSFYQYHGISTIVSEIELTFDFNTRNRIGLRDVLKSHVCLKNSKTKPCAYSWETFYANNLRKSDKGLKVYLRPRDKEIVRLELTLKRPLIRRLGLEFPLSNIDSVDLLKFFSFSFFDEKQIRNHLHWKNRKMIDKYEKRTKGYGSLVRSMINSRLNCIIEKNDSLMEFLFAAKQTKILGNNYSRFIKPFDLFNSDFFEISSHISFIPGKPSLPATTEGVLKNRPVSLKMIV